MRQTLHKPIQLRNIVLQKKVYHRRMAILGSYQKRRQILYMYVYAYFRVNTSTGANALSLHYLAMHYVQYA